MRIDELTGVKKYKTKTLWDFINDFTSAGGEFLGSGKFARVLGHPRWNYVYKFFVHDDCYLRFARWAINHQGDCPHVPVFYNKPRRMVPFYKRHKTEAMVYVVKTERLEPINPKVYDVIELYLFNSTGMDVIKDPTIIPWDTNKYNEMHQAARSAYRDKNYEELDRLNAIMHKMDQSKHKEPYLEVFKRFPQFKDFYVWFHKVFANVEFKCDMDIHQNNVMQREDGTIVLTDPLWHGMSPYAIEAEMRKAEYMDYGDEEDINPKDYVDGGKLPKKPKKPKPRKPIVYDDDDMPF